VKRFINVHLPEYADVDIKYIGGADPEMVFLDNGEEVEVRGSHDQLLAHI